MATITINTDGTLTAHLTPIEMQTVAGLQDDSLAQYVTLWLEEKAKNTFNDLFKRLSPERQAFILTEFQSAQDTPQADPVVKGPV